MRKTVDSWQFFTNYGAGTECECIEFSRKAMVENRKAYREAGVLVKIIKKRIHLREFAYEFTTGQKYSPEYKTQADKYLSNLIHTKSFKDYIKDLTT